MTRINQAYNRQRALCEDPALISQWFKLIEETKAKYSIFDKDIYNFDEYGFMMGKITTQLVMTGSERRGWPKAIQLGNHKWVTVIPELTQLAGLSHRSSTLLASIVKRNSLG
jgi:hypothetical protein